MHVRWNRTNTALRAGGMLLAAVLAGAPRVDDLAAAQCATLPRDSGFEAQTRARVSSPWIHEGQAQVEIGMGNARAGNNNALLRNTRDWNAIRSRVQLTAGARYTLRGFVRTSDNVRDGYFGFRDAAQRPVAETRFGPLPRYRELRVVFRPAATGTYNLFAGFWAPGQDAWVRVDDMRMEGPCGDVVLNPVDG